MPTRNLLVLLSWLLLASTVVAQPKGPAAGLREKLTVENDVTYGKVGGVELKLDVIRPKAERTEPRPCIVWIHGGGWQNGNKNSGLGRLAAFVASGDYVGVSVGYRLTDVASWPAQIEDCKAAIRYVRANAQKLGIDPDKIGVWGSSAGGHLVSLLGTSGDVKELEGSNGTPNVSSRVSCVVDYCGPSDFLLFGLDSPRMNEPGQPVYKLLGGPLKENETFAKQASPVTHVTRDDPPFLIVHGTDDRTVGLAQAERLYKAQKEAGIDTTFIKIVGGGHAIGGPEIAERVEAFFARHLLGKKDAVVSSEPIQQAAKK